MFNRENKTFETTPWIKISCKYNLYYNNLLLQRIYQSIYYNTISKFTRCFVNTTLVILIYVFYVIASMWIIYCLKVCKLYKTGLNSMAYHSFFIYLGRPSQVYCTSRPVIPAGDDRSWKVLIKSQNCGKETTSCL